MTAFSFTGLFVLGGGACAALAAAIMAAAVTADESTSVGMGAFCLLFPGGPGACAVLPTDTGCNNDHDMIQTGFMGAANMTGGADRLHLALAYGRAHLVDLAGRGVPQCSCGETPDV